MVQEVSLKDWNRESTFESCSKHWSARKINQTIQFTKLVFQDFSIQMYQTECELCTSAKWLPEPKKYQFMQISNPFKVSEECCLHWVVRSANVRATSTSSCSLSSFADSHQKEPSQSVASKSNKLSIFHGAKFEKCSFKSRIVQ